MVRLVLKHGTICFEAWPYDLFRARLVLFTFFTRARVAATRPLSAPPLAAEQGERPQARLTAVALRPARPRPKTSQSWKTSWDIITKGVIQSQMPSGQGKKRASFFGWLTLKGNPSRKKRKFGHHWATGQSTKHVSVCSNHSHT